MSQHQTCASCQYPKHCSHHGKCGKPAPRPPMPFPHVADAEELRSRIRARLFAYETEAGLRTERRVGKAAALHAYGRNLDDVAAMYGITRKSFLWLFKESDRRLRQRFIAAITDWRGGAPS